MRRKSRIILGLNSGTSADGVDAAACEISGRGLEMRVKLIGHVSRSYPPELRRRILAIMAPAESHTEELCRLHTAVGQVFAETAAKAVKSLGLKRVDAIGSHGQTICHLPPDREKRITRGRGAKNKAATRETGTLQIGDAAIIGQRVPASVVSQFRQADMAVGGQGAPLVPWTDYVLFAHPRRSRVIQNIGGIANLTWLPAGGKLSDVIAFDTGPGNMLIDALVSHFTRRRERYDKGGRLAAMGNMNAWVFAEMMTHPYLAKPLPKSCGREQFGEQWMKQLLKEYSKRRIPANDWIATATMFSAVSMMMAYFQYLPLRKQPLPMDEIILCGGGSRNRTLLENCATTFSGDEEFEPPSFSTTADHGIAAQAKECVSFAMLAAACLDRVPANLPQVTGASRPVVLGQVYTPDTLMQ